mmetsp:Transcript_18903/g.35271  ORF Transcript_18903/g.35271 Transcript_18903/m.35271 type:complete len:252 (+) Transcript_18903:633-1388(+)
MKSSHVPPVIHSGTQCPCKLVLVQVQLFQFDKIIQLFRDASTQHVLTKIQNLQLLQESNFRPNGSRQEGIAKSEFRSYTRHVVTNNSCPFALVHVFYTNCIDLGKVRKIFLGLDSQRRLASVRFHGTLQCIIYGQNGESLQQFGAVIIWHKSSFVGLFGQPLDSHKTRGFGVFSKVHLIILKKFHQGIDVVACGLRRGSLCCRACSGIERASWSGHIIGAIRGHRRLATTSIFCGREPGYNRRTSGSIATS